MSARTPDVQSQMHSLILHFLSHIYMRYVQTYQVGMSIQPTYMYVCATQRMSERKNPFIARKDVLNGITFIKIAEL